MEVIVLEGFNKRGKTNTLGTLYALMANTKGAKVVAGPLDIYSQKTKEPKDFAALLDYPGAKQGQKIIAVATAGDSPSIIQDGIDFAFYNKADILIIPNSTNKPSSALFNGHTIQRIVQKNGIKLLGLPSSDWGNCLVDNMKTAQDIIAVL